MLKLKKIDFDKTNGQLAITIDEGIVHKIVVEGNELSRTPLIMRELVFNEGEYLTSNGLAQSLKNLRTTGLFNSVDINNS